MAAIPEYEIREGHLIQAFEHELANGQFSGAVLTTWDREFEDAFFGRRTFSISDFAQSGATDEHNQSDSFHEDNSTIETQRSIAELGDENYGFSKNDTCERRVSVSTGFDQSSAMLTNCSHDSEQTGKADEQGSLRNMLKLARPFSTPKISWSCPAKTMNVVYDLDLPLRSPTCYSTKPIVVKGPSGRAAIRSKTSNVLEAPLSLSRISIAHFLDAHPVLERRDGPIHCSTLSSPNLVIRDEKANQFVVEELDCIRNYFRSDGFTDKQDYLARKAVFSCFPDGPESESQVSESSKDPRSQSMPALEVDLTEEDDYFLGPITPRPEPFETSPKKIKHSYRRAGAQHQYATRVCTVVEGGHHSRDAPSPHEVSSHPRPPRKRSSSAPGHSPIRSSFLPRKALDHEEDAGRLSKTSVDQTFSPSTQHPGGLKASIQSSLRIPVSLNSIFWAAIGSPSVAGSSSSSSLINVQGFLGQFDLHLPLHVGETQHMGHYTFGDPAQANGLVTHKRFMSRVLSMNSGTNFNLDPSSMSYIILHHAQEAAFGAAALECYRSENESNFRRDLHRECTLARLEGVAVGYYRYYLGFLTVEDYISINVCVCWDECWCSKMCTRFGDLKCPCSSFLAVDDWHHE